MNVKELIERLKLCDPEEVVVVSGREDGAIPAEVARVEYLGPAKYEDLDCEFVIGKVVYLAY